MKKLELIILLSINILFGSRKYGGRKLKKEWFEAFIPYRSNIVTYGILRDENQCKLINASRDTIYITDLNDGNTQKFPIDQIQSMEGSVISLIILLF